MCVACSRYGHVLQRHIALPDQDEVTQPLANLPRACPHSNITSIGNEPVWKKASSALDAECLWARIPTLPGMRRGVWCSWVALTGGTGWSFCPSAAKPSTAYLHNELLPWLCLHTLRRLSSRKMSLFFLYLLWGRARTHTWLKAEGRSNVKGSYPGKRVQGLTVVVLPSVTSTTAKEKRHGKPEWDSCSLKEVAFWGAGEQGELEWPQP